MKESKFVPRAAFNMTKVKCLKDEGLAVSYTVTETSGQDVYENEYTVKKEASPSPDLIDVMNRFVPCVEHSLGVSSIRNEIRNGGTVLDVTDSVLDNIDGIIDRWLDTVKVTGAVIAGSGEKRGISVIADINGVSVVTKKFTIPGNKTLEELTDALQNEVYEFVFCNKTAQLEIFDTDLEPTQEALTNE